jgi:2-polyprenyl-6-methoxyphenol hydroxylase-like FAD-dependent oxidoreductase
MFRPQVLVVGAGPTGLVLALALARRNVPVRIVDQAEGPGEASRAMAVQARTLELYQQFGIADAAVALGIPVPTLHLRRGGHEAARISLHDIGRGISPFPFALSLPQDDHERFLVDRLQDLGVKVEWSTALVRFDQSADEVHAVLSGAGGEETVRADYLCGCDGAHSAVRRGLGLDFPGGTYEQSFYVADVHAVGDVDQDLFVNLGERGVALMLPVRSRAMQRVIGTVPEALQDRTDLTFEDIRPSAERLIGVRVDQVNWFSTYRVHHRVADRFRDGCVFIAGDAGHIHSPAGGQGMNTGIGDAVNLGWKLADVLQGRLAPAVLDTYESERIAFARQLVSTTDAAFRLAVGQGPASRALRTELAPRAAGLLARLPLARRLMFSLISQTRIAYRDSALSQGRVGRVQAGDRLPWAPESGADNYAAFAADWSLHVYGEATPGVRTAAQSLELRLVALPYGAVAAKAGLQRDAVYLLRPDGHVAFTSPEQDAATLLGYAAQIGLRPAQREPATSSSMSA